MVDSPVIREQVHIISVGALGGILLTIRGLQVVVSQVVIMSRMH